ncbi:hypothetical protein [Azohydromonas caseinilytica]|uniref:Uncharacterized protein n=1 Tax=Azohydromonas caseinilytica TaxID=2728836 RepID=A0A848FFX8_9BURK|nr:hypothetical protein [Azohydromonas caseinilytica]NML17219.1 hypothetical protein [Azohydromonas caseinilytica]
MSKFDCESSRVWGPVRRHAAWAAGAASLAGMLAVLPVQAELGEQSLGATQATPESTGVFYVYPGRPRVWLSRHGNLLRFEGPQGYDHIGVGELSEGYVLCYGSRQAWDVGYTESGFGPSSASCSGSSCTIIRNTTDGQFRLRQVIWKNEIERALNVEMTLTKLGQSPAYGVILRRQVDPDVDAGGSLGSGSFVNWFGATERESVWAWNSRYDTSREGHAVTLRQIIRSPGYVPYWAKVTAQILDTSCSPGNLAESGPVQGDYGATLQYDVGTMNAGAVFTGRVQYQRN